MAATNKCQRTCLLTNGIEQCESASLNGVARAGRRTITMCDATSRGVIPSHGAQQHQPRGHPQPLVQLLRAEVTPHDERTPQDKHYQNNNSFKRTNAEPTQDT